MENTEENASVELVQVTYPETPWEDSEPEENPEPEIDRMIREVHEIYSMVEHIRPIIMSITQDDVDKVAGNPMVKMLIGNLFKK